MLQILMTHLGQTVWRQQTTEIFTDILMHLRRVVLPCSTCCNVVLQHLAADNKTLFNLLLRCTHPKTRSQTRVLLLDSLKFSREKDLAQYGIESPDQDAEPNASNLADGILTAVAMKLRTLADESYRTYRSWDDFYLALNQIVTMGHAETAALLEHGILEFCAKLFCIHTVKRFQVEEEGLWEFMGGKKNANFNRLISLLFQLMSHTDINLTVLSGDESRTRRGTLDRERTKFPLSYLEKQILLHWDRQAAAIAVLDKTLELFDESKGDQFFPGDIVKWMMESTDAQVRSNVFRTIIEGMGLEAPHCEPYIQAGVLFCEASPNSNASTTIISSVSDATLPITPSSSTQEEERQHPPSGDIILDFFFGVFNIEKRRPDTLYLQLLEQSCRFAVPLLLHAQERVRRRTQVFLQGLYEMSEDSPHDIVAARWQCIRCVVEDMANSIVHKINAGIPRLYLNHLIATYQTLIQMLYTMSQSEDADMEGYKSLNDATLFKQYHTEIETLLRAWPDEGTPLSTGDLYDQSDYGSESDDAHELLEN